MRGNWPVEHLNQTEKWLKAKHQSLNVQSTQEGAAKEQRLAPISDPLQWCDRHPFFIG